MFTDWLYKKYGIVVDGETKVVDVLKYINQYGGNAVHRYMSDLAKKQSAKMTPEERSNRAKKAVQARIKKNKLLKKKNG